MTDVEKLLRAPHGEDEIRAYYGWNDSYLLGDATPGSFWERDQIRAAKLPKPMKFTGRPVHTMRVHKRLVERFESLYEEILRAGLWSAVETYGGAYTFRLIRGGSALSMHAFGAAVDHDPARNPLGADPGSCYFGSKPEGQAVVRIFEEHGFFWGGRFKGRKDAMHFQFGTGY